MPYFINFSHPAYPLALVGNNCTVASLPYVLGKQQLYRCSLYSSGHQGRRRALEPSAHSGINNLLSYPYPAQGAASAAWVANVFRQR